MIAGAGLCDEAAVRLVSEGPDERRKLVELNVPFDLDPEGDLDITREGGHHRRRIVHAGGDATGARPSRRSRTSSPCANVTFMPHNFFVDILTDDNREVTGCAVLDRHSLYHRRAEHLVIATGGIGH